MTMLTEDEAFLAMFGNCLVDMSLLSDGSSADPAVKYEWRNAVDLAIAGKVDATLKLR
jgi:microcompartment protein CcmK/EutM